MVTFLIALGACVLPLFEHPANNVDITLHLIQTNTITASPTNPASFAATSPTASTVSIPRVVAVVILIVIAILAAVSAAYKAHLKRVYDPTLVMHFEEQFEQMAHQRGKAAAALLLYSTTRDWDKTSAADEIEPILDFLDNLGFYLYGNQISERVLHQSFCHWIWLYYQDGNSYITLRREGAEPERSTWEHIDYLVSEVLEIEATKQGCSRQDLKLSTAKYKKYLLQEFEEGESAFKTQFRKAHPEVFAAEGASTGGGQ